MKSIIKKIKKNKFLTLIIGTGAALSLLVIIPSGSYYCLGKTCGYFFWGAHEIDAVWHIALANNSFSSWPFSNPIFAGEALMGYNYFFDVVLSLISRLGIPADVLYFKVTPVIWIVLFIWVTLLLVKGMKKDYLYTCFLFFFMFFGSTLAPLLKLYHDGTFFGIDSFGGALNLTNQQFAFSLVGLLLVMYLLQTKKPTLKRDTLIGLLIFINTALKFYASVITIVFVLTFYGLKFLKDKNAKRFVVALGIAGISALLSVMIFYNPFASAKGVEPVLSFSPFALSRAIIEDPTRFYMERLVLARYYLLERGWGPRLVAIEALSVVLFVVFHFGSRIVALWTILHKSVMRTLTQMDISIATTMLAGFLMALLFIQRGHWWNTIQFFYYTLFLSSFFAAEYMSTLIKKKTLLHVGIAAVIIIFTIPFNIDVARVFSQVSEAASYISVQEREALDFLKKQPRGVVLNFMSQEWNPPAKGAQIRQRKSPFVEAYGEKIGYVDAEIFLQLLGVNYKPRLVKVRAHDLSVLDDVDYVYYHNKIDYPLPDPRLTQIFKNKEVTIYKMP